MAYDLKDATIRFRDGSKTELTFKAANGSLGWAKVDSELSEIKMDFVWKFVKSNNCGLTLIELLRNDEGKFVSSDEDCSSPYAVNISFHVKRRGNEDVTLGYKNFRYEITHGGFQAVHLQGVSIFESTTSS